MTESTFIKPDYQTEDETKAGNYFVSNYPPFSFWNDEDVPCVSSLINSPSPGNAPLGGYYHVPFSAMNEEMCPSSQLTKILPSSTASVDEIGSPTSY